MSGRFGLAAVAAVVMSGWPVWADDVAGTAEQQRRAEIVLEYFKPPQRDLANIGCSERPCEVDFVQTKRSGPFRRGYYDLDRILSELGRMEARRLTDLLRRFPDARACLADDAFEEGGYDLTRLRWSALRTDLALEVCLFRVHSAISDPELSEIWFQTLGVDARVHVPGGESVPRYKKASVWSYMPDDVPLLSTTRWKHLPSITLHFEANGRLTQVRLLRTYK